MNITKYMELNKITTSTPKQMTKNEIIIEFKKSLDKYELKAFKIAEDHLKDTFDIVRSNAFQEWFKNQKNSIICIDEIF